MPRCPQSTPRAWGASAAATQSSSCCAARRRAPASTSIPHREPSCSAARPECDLFLDDVTVSRRHAELHAVDGTWELADSGSLNGSYVNRRRIDRQLLAGGDEVQIGKYRFVFLEAAAGEGA